MIFKQIQNNFRFLVHDSKLYTISKVYTTQFDLFALETKWSLARLFLLTHSFFATKQQFTLTFLWPADTCDLSFTTIKFEITFTFRPKQYLKVETHCSWNI